MKLPDEIQFLSSAFQTQKTTDSRMDGKVSVITGATSGVGYHAAKRLAKGGSTLILVCRNADKAEEVRKELIQGYNANVDIVLADFSKLPDVRRAAAYILENYKRVDVLINNAGLHRTTRTLTEEGFETVFCVNHLASFLFTRLLLKRMIEHAPTRIIQVNSEGHRFGGLDLDDLDWARRPYRGLKGYGASKVAQLLTVWELADLLEDTGVTINAMHPGTVKSNIGMDNGPLYKWFHRLFVRPFLRNTKISGEAIYYLAAASEMQNVSGKFFNQTVEESPMPIATDRKLGKRVWQISEELTGLPKMELKVDMFSDVIELGKQLGQTQLSQIKRLSGG
ncbi:MAG TPA: SDR family oxidoreductase [Anaerolineales bacterium]|jgi:NAD(P)-dependent dehydrogenase (short-subunit alcohol dehydrogenase family)|nr:SDR family oxidoreductase [Anaerolineales bacterium]